MSGLVLVARLQDRSGALERLLGLLRRRALPVESMAVYRTDPAAVDVSLRFGELSTPAERIEAELNTLVDLIGLKRLPTEPSQHARELALAHTDGDVGTWPESLGNVVRRELEGIVELTGTPEEIDGALSLMSARGVLAGSARTGAVFPPDRPEKPDDPDEPTEPHPREGE